MLFYLLLTLAILGIFLCIAVLVLFTRKEKQEYKKLLEQYNKNTAKLNYRDSLLTQMRKNNDYNVEYLRNRRYANPYSSLKFLEEYSKRSREAFDMWDSITWESMKDSDLPVEHFYPQEVLDKLLWRFEPEPIKNNSEIVH